MSSIFPAPLSFLFYHLSLTLSPLLLSTSPLSLIFFPSFFSTTIYNILFSPSLFFSLLSLVPPILPPLLPHYVFHSFLSSTLYLVFFLSLLTSFLQPATSPTSFLPSTLFSSSSSAIDYHLLVFRRSAYSSTSRSLPVLPPWLYLYSPSRRLHPLTLVIRAFASSTPP